MGMGVLLQKEPKIPDAHKTGAAISGPKIADKEFYEHGDCSERGGGGIRGAGGGGGTGAGRVSGGVCNNCFFFSPSELPFFRRTVLGNSRGPCYQRDLRMQGIFCWLSLGRWTCTLRMLKCALRMLQPSIADLLCGFQDRGRSRNEDRGRSRRSRKIEEDRGRSRKIEEDRGRSRKIEEIEEDRGRSRKIEEDRGRSRKIEEKIEEDRGKIEEDRGRSRKMRFPEFAVFGQFPHHDVLRIFWAVFPTMMFCGFFGQTAHLLNGNAGVLR